MKKIALLFLCMAGTLFAEVSFSDLQLDNENNLLFTASVDIPVYGNYETLLYADIDDEEMKQLTFFPEELLYLKESSKIQIQNRFGVFRVDEDGGAVEVLERFPAFVNGRQIKTGKIPPIEASPDGRFLVFSEPETPGYANLILYDLEKGTELTIAEHIQLSLDGPPVLWSPDSQFFVYSKNATIYYYSIEQYDGGRALSESYRSIGEGSVNNVFWSANSNLFYVDGTIVYKVQGNEFFTRSLYRSLLKTGRVAGKIPFTFDPNFDKFWISPDGNKILLSKGGRNVFLYYLQTDDFLNIGENITLPYLYLPRNTRLKQVLWSAGDILTIYAASIRKGENGGQIFRINIDDRHKDADFSELNEAGVRQILMSPNEAYALVLKDQGAVVYNYKDWTKLTEIYHPSPLHAVWQNNSEIVIGGRYYTESVSIENTDDKNFICFSQVERYGFSNAAGMIQSQSKEKVMQYLLSQDSWKDITGADFSEPPKVSRDYRVYAQPMQGSSYTNMIMVRSVRNLGTRPLFSMPEVSYEKFPTVDEPVDFTNFSHGSRIRRREVSIVFDAIDSVEGLAYVLNTLSEYSVKATFFLNGDFVRQHPGAVKEIAESGHEVGSMFFTYFNMTDSRFQIDRDFIKQGLAKNEDDYYMLTGKELALYWHAPYYFVSPDILRASKEMNYTYIGRDIDSLDWVPRRDDNGVSRFYMTAADLIERILDKKKPGSIISMTIGQMGELGAYREDYLFQRLDVLLNSLIARGYRVVPVSELIEHSR